MTLKVTLPPLGNVGMVMPRALHGGDGHRCRGRTDRTTGGTAAGDAGDGEVGDRRIGHDGAVGFAGPPLLTTIV